MANVTYNIPPLVPATAYNNNAVLMAYLQILDTSAHTYRTDPFYAYGGSNAGIQLVQAGRSFPPYLSLALYVNNTQNQQVAVQPISNITSTQAYSDDPITALLFNVPAGQTLQQDLNFHDYPSQYISMQFTFSVAPTSGFIEAYLFTYY